MSNAVMNLIYNKCDFTFLTKRNNPLSKLLRKTHVSTVFWRDQIKTIVVLLQRDDQSSVETKSQQMSESL